MTLWPLSVGDSLNTRLQDKERMPENHSRLDIEALKHPNSQILRRIPKALCALRQTFEESSSTTTFVGSSIATG